MAFSHHKTEAIFLKKKNYREANQIFTVFTKEFGKIRILGRSIRKIDSKLRSGADLFFFSEIEFVEGKVYNTLTGAEKVKQFENIYHSEKKMKRASVIANIVDSLWGRQQKDEATWKMLVSFFKELNKEKETDLWFYYFLWNFFSLSGFAPNLYNCCLCGKDLSSDFLRFYPAGGGFLDKNCFKKMDKKEKSKTEDASSETLEVLRLFLSKDFGKMKELEKTEIFLEDLSSISNFYFRFLKECHQGL